MTLLDRDVIAVSDLSDDEIQALLRLAREFAGPEGRPTPRNELADRIVACLFFEPSTRTRLSFESAAHRLGARVIGFSSPAATSFAKGETLSDTIRTVSHYADLIVLRHPKDGSARLAAELSEVPVVNAGDGSHSHPTQSLVDFFTIGDERGTTTNNNVVLLGDLRFGRTTHSLATLLSRFGNKVTCVSPPGLEMPEGVIEECARHGRRPDQTNDLVGALADADVLYVTRIQKERFADPAEYLKYAGSYRIDDDILRHAEADLTILHPLPRVGEIDHAVDRRPGAAWFRQARNGVPVRMALLTSILKETPQILTEATR
ncbi:MAG: aspartate carbamoyltransferase [Euryarchaeota archaeon]|nr:aspartate carbamoyltransferase [Euryarchaeota archaeon]